MATSMLPEMIASLTAAPLARRTTSTATSALTHRLGMLLDKLEFKRNVKGRYETELLSYPHLALCLGVGSPEAAEGERHQ